MDNIKGIYIFIIRVLEGREREKGPEKIFEEVIAENFLTVTYSIIVEMCRLNQ